MDKQSFEFAPDGEQYTLADLVNIMRHLSSENGCPWDRRQTHHSLERYLLEESWEAVEAIEQNDWQNLCEELGDVLMQIAFHAVLAERAGRFEMQDVIDGICRKMIRRHSHVFGEDVVADEQALKVLWARNKAEEQQATGATVERSVTIGRVPQTVQASGLLKRAAKAGLDTAGAFDEAAAALEACRSVAEQDEPNGCAARETAAGALLAAAVAVCRELEVEPELTLYKNNRRFERRLSDLKKETDIHEIG